ncbi:membrane protein insertion efficiency factor YidD [Cellulosimicrobium composti]|uniref:Putative membrane protein insertion efficiency factor n=1 Tax=Cellulosimicrobium composti TaxID=2672572 RepID=A0ABX0BC93_9MICO|nr:membrane protein insertion efficiency factor YidD [Cellulosimicrobium composti]NDO88641.1 membrane protein insertion efficiency factor YidD [Cellulosimicrobium composti]
MTTTHPAAEHDPRPAGVDAPAVPSAARRLLDVLRRVPALTLIGMIRAYQSVISPMTGPTCKYYPSCSQYALTAVRRHGALRGTGLALWRLLRCNPWSLGGVDDVPPARHTH